MKINKHGHNAILKKIHLLFYLVFVEYSYAKYIETGPCRFCKYANFCEECRHCPCESRGSEDLPYCEYCKYCQFCRLKNMCEYCEEGGMLSTVAETISGWMETIENLFRGHDHKKKIEKT